MNATNGNVQKRRAILQHALNNVGYADSCIQFDWPVSNPEELRQYGQDQDPYNLPGGKPWRLDVVAFCDERERNWATTAFAAELNRLDLVRDREAGAQRAKQLFDTTAAPNVLFAGNGSADLWLGCWGEAHVVHDIPFTPDALKQHFHEHRRELEREALARLRGGQRYLFEGVYNAQRDELAQFLHRGISKATWLSPTLTGKGHEADRKSAVPHRDRPAGCQDTRGQGFLPVAKCGHRRPRNPSSRRAKGQRFLPDRHTRDLATLDGDLARSK